MRLHDAPASSKRETVTVSALRQDELAPGTSVGRYVIVTAVARGAFGTVYQAAAASGEAFAIKVLHGTLRDAPGVLSRFQGEISIMRDLRHPGIVEIRDVGHLPDGRPFVVMDWVVGRTLEAVIAEGPLSLDRAIAILGKLCDVLAVVHAAGVVHRDVKSANVMLVGEGPDEHVKLLDFGIAKLVHQASSLTLQGARVGTPSHMAPEQILGGRVTPQTDIYALGVILFAMLTGRLPFQAQTPIEVEEMHLDTRPPRASESADVPVAVSDVVRRCLAKKTIQRHGSVTDLMAELEAARVSKALEPSSLRAGRAIAVGVFLAAEARGAEGRAAVDAARPGLEEEGLDIALEDEQGLWLLCIAGLSSVATDLGPAREKALSAALAAVRGASENFPLGAVVHVAPVTTLAVEGAVQIAGGELLSPERWADGATPGRVEATPEALVGVEAVVSGASSPLGRRVVSGLPPHPGRRVR